jgi:hypothetical protein
VIEAVETVHVDIRVVVAAGKVSVLGLNEMPMEGSAGEILVVKLAVPTKRVLPPVPLSTVSTAVTLVATPAVTLAEVGEIVNEAKLLAAHVVGGSANMAAMTISARRYRIRVFIVLMALGGSLQNYGECRVWSKYPGIEDRFFPKKRQVFIQVQFNSCGIAHFFRKCWGASTQGRQPRTHQERKKIAGIIKGNSAGSEN